MTSMLFFLLAGLAIACAVLMVYHRNPLYSAISLIGVFIALACIYLLLAAPFIAVTQVLVYAGAIMVLVIFVIMLLNLEEDKPITRLRYLYIVGIVLGIALFFQTLFIYQVVTTSNRAAAEEATAGLTINIGRAMFTEYILPVEIAGVLLLMAIVGAMILSRKNGHSRTDKKED